MLAVLAEAFHVTPYVVAQELLDDPEQLLLQCLPLLRYADAYHAYERAEDKVEDLKGWEGSSVMDDVERNVFELHKARVKKRSGG